MLSTILQNRNLKFITGVLIRSNGIKINGVDVIDDDRRGIFKIKSRCLYNIPDRISE